MLDVADIGAVIQHDGGAGVAQGVSRTGLPNVRQLDVAMDQTANPVRIKGLPPAVQENGVADRAGAEHRT